MSAKVVVKNSHITSKPAGVSQILLADKAGTRSRSIAQMAILQASAEVKTYYEFAEATDIKVLAVFLHEALGHLVSMTSRIAGVKNSVERIADALEGINQQLDQKGPLLASSHRYSAERRQMNKGITRREEASRGTRPTEKATKHGIGSIFEA